MDIKPVGMYDPSTHKPFEDGDVIGGDYIKLSEDDDNNITIGSDGGLHVPSTGGGQGPVGPQGPAGPAGAQGPEGPAGIDGQDGDDGKSAYQEWLDLGNTGSEQDFIDSLRGAQGPAGPAGVAGEDGKSTYQEWLDAGNTGSEQDFLDSLIGPQGATGPQGPAGEDATVYGIPVLNVTITQPYTEYTPPSGGVGAAPPTGVFTVTTTNFPVSNVRIYCDAATALSLDDLDMTLPNTVVPLPQYQDRIATKYTHVPIGPMGGYSEQPGKYSYGDKWDLYTQLPVGEVKTISHRTYFTTQPAAGTYDITFYVAADYIAQDSNGVDGGLVIGTIIQPVVFTLVVAELPQGVRIYYNRNSVTAIGDDPVDETLYALTDQVLMPPTSALINYGYVLAHWSPSPSDDAERYSCGMPYPVSFLTDDPNGEVTLYAIWNPEPNP